MVVFSQSRLCLQHKNDKRLLFEMATTVTDSIGCLREENWGRHEERVKTCKNSCTSRRRANQLDQVTVSGEEMENET